MNPWRIGWGRGKVYPLAHAFEGWFVVDSNTPYVVALAVETTCLVILATVLLRQRRSLARVWRAGVAEGRDLAAR